MAEQENKCLKSVSTPVHCQIAQKTELFMAAQHTTMRKTHRPTGAGVRANVHIPYTYCCVYIYRTVSYYIVCFRSLLLQQPAAAAAATTPVDDVYGGKAAVATDAAVVVIPSTFSNSFIIWCAICGKWIGYGHDQQLYRFLI